LCSGIKHNSLLSSSGLTATILIITLCQSESQSLTNIGPQLKSVIETDNLLEKVIEAFSLSGEVIERSFHTDQVIETESERSEVIEV
jgi:hypothetical protein